jgi:hypothetical protein
MDIETTPRCGQTPRLLLLLEEIGTPYELTLRPDGHFLATYGRPGPRLVDDDLTLFECATMLRQRAPPRRQPSSAKRLHALGFRVASGSPRQASRSCPHHRVAAASRAGVSRVTRDRQRLRARQRHRARSARVHSARKRAPPP